MSADITVDFESGRFNYRAAGLLINDGKILAMMDDGIDHWYLPGGRVLLHETAENAVLREITEELGLSGMKIERPLWLNQAYFDCDGHKYHELCVYFLIDHSKTDLLARGEKFRIVEGKRGHNFEWLEFSRLEKEIFFPLFLKRDIYNLPRTFTLRTEIE